MNALEYCKEERLEGQAQEFKATKFKLKDLPEEKKIEIIRIINERPITFYKKKLNLSKKMSFGVELEVDEISDKIFSNIKRNKKIMEILCKNHNIPIQLLDAWEITYDASVPDGLEYVSPILHDTEEEWDSLKAACEILEVIGASKGETCGGHIHIGADILGTDRKSMGKLF